MLSLEDDGSLSWSVPQARQLNGLVPEAKSLANLERRVIRALRLRDPYCVVTSEESKTQWEASMKHNIPIFAGVGLIAIGALWFFTTDNDATK